MEGLPRYEVHYEETFHQSLGRVGINWALYENLARPGIDTFLAIDPYEAESTHPVPGTDYRFLWTEIRFVDLPPMLIAYEVDDINRQVSIVGAEAVWGDDDLVPTF